MSKRHGNRWSITEILNLQREYELLGMSVQQIADKHERSVQSILFKLHCEGLTSSLYDANGYTGEKNTKPTNSKNRHPKVVEKELSDTDSSSDFEDNNESVDANVNTLSDRVWNLETSVGEISSMVKQMFDQMTSQKQAKKLAPLRRSSS
jgi:hypothetical protein